MAGIIIEAKGRKVEFGVMKLPNRKTKCLYKTRGAMTEPLAYFSSESNAEEFEKIIDFMAQVFGNEPIK